MSRRTPGALALAAALFTLATPIGAAQTGRLVFVGTYTKGTSQGIYAFRFDERSGTLTPAGLAAATPNPSFLIERPDGRVLFAVNELETFRGEATGSVTSFSVDAATGRLAATSVQASGGTDPCHLALDASGRFLAVANYTSGTFALLPVATDGTLGPAATVLTHQGSGPNRARQNGPHAHEVVFTDDNRYLLGVDLGLDRVFAYHFDAANGTLTPDTPPSASLQPGSGPRHLAFAPDRRHGFVISELASSITSFGWHPDTGVLAMGSAVSSLPPDFSGTSAAAEIQVHPNGRFVYGSNRGDDSITVFAADGAGALTFVERVPTRGRTPRHFTLDPTGRWLIAANQDSNSLAVFAVDPQTGRLTPAGPLVDIGSPVRILFAP